MNEPLKCDCGCELFIPLYQLRRDEEGNVVAEHGGTEFTCAICNEIYTFYSKSGRERR